MRIMFVNGCRVVGQICLFIFTCNSVNAQTGSEMPKLILISMDGFRWNYLDQVKESEVPNFMFLRRNGAWAKEGITNTFITKTLADHTTLVTGLYEESHGIMANEFYDPIFKEGYNIDNVTQSVDPKWFDTGAEPIWVTNQKADTRRRSGSVMWPGCGAPQNKYVPSRYILFDKHMGFITRINVFMSWFVLNEPINLGLLYINEPDHTGHKYGPESPELKKMILKLDKVLGYLFQKLKDSELWGEINIILTSDHGMADTPKDKEINLDDHVKPELYTMYTTNPVSMVLPNEGREEEVYNGFKNVSNLNVYWKHEIPEKYHFKNNRRVAPILLLSEPNYSIAHNKSVYKTVGNHGYSNSFKDMHPFFMAYGPAFNNVAIKSFLSVDVYVMMCYVLDIQPAPTNGSLERVQALLKPKLPTRWINIVYFILVAIVILVAVIIAVAVFRRRRRLLRKKGYPEYSLNQLIPESEDEDTETEEIP